MTKHTHRRGAPPALGNTVAIAPTPTPPSWWLVPPEEFARRHQAELDRIQNTGFGKRDKLITQSSGVVS